MSENQLKQFHLHLDEEIVNSVTLWLENKADLNDECGCYATADILGMVIGEVWGEVRDD